VPSSACHPGPEIGYHRHDSQSAAAAAAALGFVALARHAWRRSQRTHGRAPLPRRLSSLLIASMGHVRRRAHSESRRVPASLRQHAADEQLTTQQQQQVRHAAYWGVVLPAAAECCLTRQPSAGSSCRPRRANNLHTRCWLGAGRHAAGAGSAGASAIRCPGGAGCGGGGDGGAALGAAGESQSRKQWHSH
jgi:hypothetical protein